MNLPTEDLADSISLSRHTVRGILSWQEQQGRFQRSRNVADRRSVTSTIAVRGTAVLKDTPMLLEDRFCRELNRLVDWKQTQTLQRIAKPRCGTPANAWPLSADALFHEANIHIQST
jgi:DNA-binding MarR family transcriptional regulator